jgi:hypothetical protein
MGPEALHRPGHARGTLRPIVAWVPAMAAKKTRKYGPKAAKKVGRAMREMKRGTLRSGRSRKRVSSRKQAIAIGLSEARSAGAKVPAKKRAPRIK